MILILAFLLNAEPLWAKINLIEKYTPEVWKNAKAIKENKTNAVVNEPKKKVTKNNQMGSQMSLMLKKIHEQNEKLNALINQKSDRPFIWDGETKIQTTQIFKGLLLNSVVSTNLESPVLVQVFRGQAIPVGTKFACKGITSNKRVLTYCDRMITPTKEVAVKVQILNLDGSSGLRGEYNDGKDSYIAGAVVSEFAKGIISTTTKPTGTSSLSSELLEGLKSSANTTTDVLLDESKKQEPKVYIEAGKPVLIYFMEGLNGY